MKPRIVWCLDGHAVSRDSAPIRREHAASRRRHARPLCRQPLGARPGRLKREVPTCAECLRRLRTPGSTWRVLAQAKAGERVELADAGVFDEFVVDDWFHLEQMNTRDWWFCVGNGENVRHFYVHIGREGRARLGLSEGDATQDRLDALCAAIRKWHRNDDDDGALFAHVLQLAGVDPREAAADEEVRAKKEASRCAF